MFNFFLSVGINPPLPSSLSSITCIPLCGGTVTNKSNSAELSSSLITLPGTTSFILKRVSYVTPSLSNSGAAHSATGAKL